MPRVRSVCFWLFVLGVCTYVLYIIGPLITNSFVKEPPRPKRYAGDGIKGRITTTTKKPSGVLLDHLKHHLDAPGAAKKGVDPTNDAPPPAVTSIPDYGEDLYLVGVKARKEFVSLSPSDTSNLQLAEAVADMDFDKDGFIDHYELKVWIAGALYMVLEEEVLSRFDTFDRNRDGEVSWQEFRDGTYGVEGEVWKSYRTREAEKKLIADDEEKFRYIDYNKDGKLNYEEFGQFLAPEEHIRWIGLLIKLALRNKDIDKDRKISFEESIAGGSVLDDYDSMVAERKRFDLHFDKNGDGYLTGLEIVNWLYPSNKLLTERQVAYLFETADKDHDGRLSYQELFDKYGKVTESNNHVREL